MAVNRDRGGERKWDPKTQKKIMPIISWIFGDSKLTGNLGKQQTEK
jgi:hypothetical protein